MITRRALGIVITLTMPLLALGVAATGSSADVAWAHLKIGENSCQGEDACTGLLADVGDNSCNGDFACESNSGPVGNVSCNGSFTCFNNSGSVSDGSCKGGACRDKSGDVGDNACNGQQACFSNSGQVGDNSCNGDIACQWAVPSWARGPATASRRATRAAVTLAITHATASWNVPTIADRWAMALAMATGPATETAVL